MDRTVPKNRRKLFVLTDCLADSCAADTYRANESSRKQKAMPVLWYREIKISYSSALTLS
jgi:hypothetical protein